MKNVETLSFIFTSNVSEAASASEVTSIESMNKLTAESSKHQCECISSIFKTSSSAVSFMRR